LRVATEEKMVQAKSLLIQGSSRGAVTSSLAAVSFAKFCIHRVHTSWLWAIPHFIRFPFFLNKMR
jgi:hypothetical protein